MAGHKCNGWPLKSGDDRLTRAYCEGMTYRTTGSAVAVPITDNPFPAGSDQAGSWDAGWNAADGAGGTIDAATAGCCALRGATVPA